MRCHDDLRAIVVLETLEEGCYQNLVERMRTAKPIQTDYADELAFQNHDQVLRELQYVCYTDQPIKEMARILDAAGHHAHCKPPERVIHEEILPHRLATTYQKFIDKDKLIHLYCAILDATIYPFSSYADIYFQQLDAFLEKSREVSLPLGEVFILRLFCGRNDLAWTLCQEHTWDSPWEQTAARACLDLLQQHNDAALAGFAESPGPVKKQPEEERPLLARLLWVFPVFGP